MQRLPKGGSRDTTRPCPSTYAALGCYHTGPPRPRVNPTHATKPPETYLTMSGLQRPVELAAASLSGARSSKVVRLFLDEGFQPEQLMPIGFGSTRPMVPNRSPSGQWVEQNLSKNRRVVIRILNPGIDYIPWDSDSISQTADSHPNHDSKKIESKLPSKETIKAKQNVSSLTPNPSR